MILRQRLLLFSFAQILSLAAVFIVLWLLVYTLSLPVLTHYLEQKTHSTAFQLLSQLDVILASGETTALENISENLQKDKDFLGLIVLDDKNQKVLAIGEFATLIQDLSLTKAQDIQWQPHAFALWAPIEFESLKLGRLYISFSFKRIYQFKYWMGFSGLAIVGCLVIAGLFAIRFSKQFVAPLTDMMLFSQAIAEGQFSRELKTTAEGELKLLANHLAAMRDGLKARDLELHQRQKELQKNQEQLLITARLASVGEMAGRVAHEVLNPITSVHGRLNNMLEKDEKLVDQNLRTLNEIMAAWEKMYQEQGFDGLLKDLSKPLMNHPKNAKFLIEEDFLNIKGILQFLTDLQSENKKNVQFLLMQVDRVTQIVDGMRGLTKQLSSPTRLDVLELLEIILTLAEDSFIRHKIHLSHSIERAYVFMDRYEFIEVANNLLRNAILANSEKYGERGGGMIDISVSTRNLRVEIRFRDTGTGISEENLPLIFEASFTTRPVEKGTGLGLSIARRLARGARGDIVVEKTHLGEGTTFLFELPQFVEEVV